MRWMKVLGLGKQTATAAKDRLQVIIAQQRSENSSPDYLPMMRKEIMDVIAKYTEVELDDIDMDLQYKDNDSVLELNVTLPEKVA